jgi:hypothetical protein
LIQSPEFIRIHFPKFHDTLQVSKDVYLLRVEGDFAFPGTDQFPITNALTGERLEQTEEELRSFWVSTLPDFLDLTVQTYLCSLAIAFPGAARVWGNVWLVDGILHRHSSHYISTLHEGIRYLTENEFYPAKDIAPELVHGWVCAQNGMLNGYSDTAA